MHQILNNRNKKKVTSALNVHSPGKGQHRNLINVDKTTKHGKSSWLMNWALKIIIFIKRLTETSLSLIN